MSNYASVVKEFIISNFLFGEDEVLLAEDNSFMETGIIDSTGILEVVAWVEETFGLKIKDADLIPENFDTVQCIANYISRHLTP